MTKKEFSYIVFSSCGDNVQEIVGVYKDLDGASYGARTALSTLFPKHGDEAKIIRCEIISQRIIFASSPCFGNKVVKADLAP